VCLLQRGRAGVAAQLKLGAVAALGKEFCKLTPPPASCATANRSRRSPLPPSHFRTRRLARKRDVRAHAERLARRIERSGLSGLADADLRLGLRGPDPST
jgi:hypothetical protein